METWIIITIVIVVLAALGAAGGLTYFYIQRRSQRRASDEYTKSLIDEALLAENLAKQQQTVTDLQATISNSNTQTGEEQKTATLQLAGSQKELEQLKNNITLAIQATNSLSRAKSAIDNNKYIEAAQNATAAELKALEDKKKAADKTTVDALNFTTSELEKQAANLKKFKESLQADTLKLAAEVGNPSIIPPVLPDSSKPSIRIAWDAAADKVATSDDRDFAIKQLSEIYMITGADAADLKKEADNLNAEPTVCERIKKIQFDNNLYGCPSRWTVFGEQCYRGPCENSPSPPAPKPPPPPTPKPPTPKPPPPDDGKKAFGDNIEEAYGLYKKERDAGKTVAAAVKTLQDKYTGVGPASTKILEDRYIASKPPAPKPPPPKPPTPKPPPPGPPSDLEKKYPYWGWGPNEGLRCANKDNTGCNTAYDANGNLYDTNPTPPPGPSPGNNPHRISDSALRMMGMDAEQLSNILAMIGGPEQSNVEWWKGVDKKDVYGYCENINDDRGVTIGVSGFVTKWGLAQKIVKDAGGGSHDVGQCRPGHPTKCSFCDWVRGNGSNQKFIDAQWNAYANEFMKLVPKYVPQQFKDNALIKGMMLDTAMNAGEFKEGNSWGLKEVTQAARGNDAASWAYSFLDARYNHFTAGNSQSMRSGRIGAWKKLVQDNKWDMKIDPCKYAFCSGHCLGC